MSWSTRRHRPALPDEPVNVHVTYPDGRVRPLDCIYVGIVDDVHMWEALLDDPLELCLGLQIGYDVLPPHTGLRLAVL